MRKIKARTKPQLPESFPEIYDGCKVILNYEAITSRKSFASTAENYRSFVEKNQGRVFTAHPESRNLVSLKEQPGWLFWEKDLIPVEEKKVSEVTKK